MLGLRWPIEIRVRWPIVDKKALAQRYFAHRPLSGPTRWLNVGSSGWLNVGPTFTHGTLAHGWQVHVGQTYSPLSGQTYVGSTQCQQVGPTLGQHVGSTLGQYLRQTSYAPAKIDAFLIN